MGKEKGKKTAGRRLLSLAALLCLCLCLVPLLRYGIDALRAGHTDAVLRENYISPSPAAAAAEGRARDYPSPAPAGDKGGPTVPPATPVPSVTARPAGERLEKVPYPGNPNAAVSARFRTLREMNPDICAWLRIDGAIDTAVTKRDNAFYMTHDALGEENVNGCVFLEETTDLGTRPYTLILYGHNMKSGAVFGCLRRWGDLSWYRSHPFITLDTLYEEGEFVVFAAATVSLEEGRKNALDLSALSSSYVPGREAELKRLLALSDYTAGAGAEASDQLLLLVTCEGDGEERRVIAARRLREGESGEAAAAAVRLTERR